MREVRWERMFPNELEAAYSACPVVYYTYGLCEPHGPQNALGLDALKAHAIACRAAKKHGGIVAPADFWHIHEIGGYAIWADEEIGTPSRNWLTSISPWQHFRNVCYHIRAAEMLRFKAAILFTGHYGPNYVDLKELVRLIQPYVGTRLYALPEFEANWRGFSGDGKEAGDHAGKVETSLLWALEPECVDVSRIPEGYEKGKMFAMGRNAGEANRLVGERMVDEEIDWLGDKANELIAEYDRIKPEHSFTTFERVETIWESVVKPQFQSFQVMQERWEGQKELSSGSPWKPNQKIFFPG